MHAVCVGLWDRVQMAGKNDDVINASVYRTQKHAWIFNEWCLLHNHVWDEGTYHTTSGTAHGWIDCCKNNIDNFQNKLQGSRDSRLDAYNGICTITTWKLLWTTNCPKTNQGVQSRTMYILSTRGTSNKNMFSHSRWITTNDPMDQLTIMCWSWILNMRWWCMHY